MRKIILILITSIFIITFSCSKFEQEHCWVCNPQMFYNDTVTHTVIPINGTNTICNKTRSEIKDYEKYMEKQWQSNGLSIDQKCECKKQ